MKRIIFFVMVLALICCGQDTTDYSVDYLGLNDIGTLKLVPFTKLYFYPVERNITFVVDSADIAIMNEEELLKFSSLYSIMRTWDMYTTTTLILFGKEIPITYQEIIDVLFYALLPEWVIKRETDKGE